MNSEVGHSQAGCSAASADGTSVFAELVRKNLEPVRKINRLRTMLGPILKPTAKNSETPYVSCDQHFRLEGTVLSRNSNKDLETNSANYASYLRYDQIFKLNRKIVDDA